MTIKFNDFLNESKLQDDYRNFFTHLLKIYGITSPTQFKDKEELSKKFYADIEKGWNKGEGLTKYGEELMGCDDINDI
jgi:hypothetical protein